MFLQSLADDCNLHMRTGAYTSIQVCTHIHTHTRIYIYIYIQTYIQCVEYNCDSVPHNACNT